MPIPISGPDERAASPLCALLFLAARSQRSIAHPEGPPAVDSRLLGQHRLARLVVLAFGSDRLRKQFAPRLLGLECSCDIFGTGRRREGVTAIEGINRLFRRTIVDRWLADRTLLHGRRSLSCEEAFQALLSVAVCIFGA